jgi:DNA-binding NtrC family response regulator
MREPTLFISFRTRQRIDLPAYFNELETGQEGTKNADKRAGIVPIPEIQEVVMKPFPPPRSSPEAKEFATNPKPTPSVKEATPVEMQPTFTLTFSLGTAMREIHDTVIRTVLQYTRGNRLRAAQMLQINPRTIRRRLGKKEAGASATRAV